MSDKTLKVTDVVYDFAGRLIVKKKSVNVVTDVVKVAFGYKKDECKGTKFDKYA
jgi:hypothetical protein